jgi:cytochrome c oxidase subunit II
MLHWLPEDVSPYGAGIDGLFRLIYYITATAFLVVTVLMVAFLVLYRYREGRRATYTHGNTMLEIVWTLIPAAIFIWLGLASKSQWEMLKMTIPATDTVIRVTAKQFNWEILYPGPDGKFDTPDDKQVDNEIHVPVGKPVHVILRSKDVIHSFFLPNLRFKQDAVPGHDISGWFQANKPGRYEIPCAELCGFGHSGMKGWLYVQSAEDYQQWFTAQWPPSAAVAHAAPISETPVRTTPDE